LAGGKSTLVMVANLFFHQSSTIRISSRAFRTVLWTPGRPIAGFGFVSGLLSLLPCCPPAPVVLGDALSPPPDGSVQMKVLSCFKGVFEHGNWSIEKNNG
jgi:hypothetical protein